MGWGCARFCPLLQDVSDCRQELEKIINLRPGKKKRENLTNFVKLVR